MANIHDRVIHIVSFLPSLSLARMLNHSQHNDQGKPSFIPPLLAIDIDTFHHIVSCLSPVDQASLALTCHPILNTLGRQTLAIKTFPLEDRLAFLRHQQPHFPSHILCYWCGLFHPRADIICESPPHPCAIRGAAFRFPGPTKADYTISWRRISTFIRDIPAGYVRPPVDGLFTTSQTIKHRVVQGKFFICARLSVANVPVCGIRAVVTYDSIMCAHQNYRTLDLLWNLVRGPAVYECLECGACMSYQIAHRERGWELRCALWVCLGDGASPVGEEWVRAVRSEEKTYYPARKVSMVCEVRTWVMFEWLGTASSIGCLADDFDSHSMV